MGWLQFQKRDYDMVRHTVTVNCVGGIYMILYGNDEVVLSNLPGIAISRIIYTSIAMELVKKCL